MFFHLITGVEQDQNVRVRDMWLAAQIPLKDWRRTYSFSCWNCRQPSGISPWVLAQVKRATSKFMPFPRWPVFIDWSEALRTCPPFDYSKASPQPQNLCSVGWGINAPLLLPSPVPSHPYSCRLQEQSLRLLVCMRISLLPGKPSQRQWPIESTWEDGILETKYFGLL